MKNLLNNMKLSDSLYVNKKLVEERFLLSVSKTDRVDSIINDDYHSYKLNKPISLDKVYFSLELFFYQGFLNSVKLMRKSSNVGGWAGYDPITEKHFHDQWLCGTPSNVKTMDNVKYQFDWGDVISIFDRKSYTSFILVKYV